MLATGSTPVLPPVAGLEGEGVFTLRTAADALGIRAYAEREMVQAAVVLGGGLVGVKAAEALRRAGLRVTLVERLPFILYPAADATAAAILSRRLEEAGVTVLTGVTAGEVAPKRGKVEAVRVGSQWIAAQLVVVAAGVRPNLAFLKGSNIACKAGILVDEHLQTNVPGIWAAGDVVEYRDILRGRSMVSGLWPNAVAMGRVAGANIAGVPLRYEGFLPVLSATEVGGLPFISAGVGADSEGEYETFSFREGENYRKLVFEGERLVGFLAVGEVDRAGFLVGLIKSQVPLGDRKKLAAAGKLSCAHMHKLPAAEVPRPVT